MDVSSLNSYNYSKYTDGNSNIIDADGNRIGRKTGSGLDMSDFMSLLAAQLSNQDMMNPVSDTEFIAQMAQFSALEGMNTLQEYTLSSYAVSYVGKHVIIYAQDEATKNYETVYGQVERVTFVGGSPLVVVDGKEYPLHTVMEVANQEIKPPSETDNLKDIDSSDSSGDSDTEVMKNALNLTGFDPLDEAQVAYWNKVAGFTD